MADLTALRDRWLRLAWTVRPIDHERAAAALMACYQSVGLAPARSVVWARSPLEALVAVHLLRRHGTRRPHLGPRLAAAAEGTHLDMLYPPWQPVLSAGLLTPIEQVVGHGRAGPWGDGPPLGQSVTTAALEVSLDTLAEEHLAGRFDESRVAALILAALGEEQPDVSEEARWRWAALELAVRETPSREWSTHPMAPLLWTQPDLAMPEMAGTAALIEALAAVGVPLPEPCTALARWAAEGSWCWAFEDVAIACERPEQVCLDAQGQLHSPITAAVRFADGFGIWAWHGVRVPEAMIDPGWDAETTLFERNAEVRRCAIERLGWEALVAGADLRPCGAPMPDPGNPGQVLTLYDLPAAAPDAARLLVCRNGTVGLDGQRHTFGLWVPRDINDPVAAAAWTYGLTAEQYDGAERRA